MQMREGLIVSGTGHALVIGWALLAGLFASDPPPEDTFAITEVSVLSNAEFDALVSNAPAPEVPTAPAPVAPNVTEAEVTTPQVQESPRAAEPLAPTPQQPETPPQVAILTPPPRTDVTPQTPAAPPAPPEQDPEAPVLDAPPTPRPAPRVAPTPAPPSEAEVAPVVQEAPTPTDTAEAPTEEAPTATAPEEAAPEIVTEAETPSRQLDASPRPQRRPERPAPTPAAVAEAPQTPPAETPPAETPPPPAETPPTPPAPEVVDPLAAAISGAIAEAQSAPTAAPAGPPLSQGERDGFRVAVQNCWNVDPGAPWALVAVTIAFDLNRDGTPVSNSLRMVGFQGGEEAQARQAFEAGRRAILRCGAQGFDLPPEKYDHWQEVEMTFDPSSMRIR